MQYLPSHLLEPIFYPNKERDLPQRITQKNSPIQSKACNTPSYLVYFSDSSIGNILPNRQTMLSYCGFSNGVFTLWSTNIQTLIVADSTDTQLKSLYCTIKKIVSFSHFLTSSSIPHVITNAIVVYANNSTSTNIIKQDKIANCSQHLDISVTLYRPKCCQYLNKSVFWSSIHAILEFFTWPTIPSKINYSSWSIPHHL